MCEQLPWLYAPKGVEAEPGDKISQLIRHLWHIYGTDERKRFLLSTGVKDRVLYPQRMVMQLIRTWRILHTFLCLFYPKNLPFWSNYWQLLHFWWHGKASRRNGDWTLFWNDACLGPGFHFMKKTEGQFLTLGSIVGWAEWHSQLDLDRQLLIIQWPLNLVSWKHIELDRWFHWTKVVPTRNLSSYWSPSLSLLPHLLVADKKAASFA